jgi:hypothetical protein
MAIPRNLANLANQLNGDGDVPKIEVGDSKVEITDAGTGKIEFTVDNVEVADFTTGAIVFNETGANQDFRVEGDTNANMFIVDASEDKVLIGDTAVNVNGNPTNQCFSFNEGSAFAFSFTGQNAYINISTAGSVINLRHQGINSGQIQINTSSVAYITSSDYRLKENISTMTGALAKVALLNPVTYQWKVDGSAGEGFIAHELQAVCPDAVSGDKDAVNEDGTIKPQGVDTSFLVATLTAAIQELKAELDQAKTRIAALEAQ